MTPLTINSSDPVDRSTSCNILPSKATHQRYRNDHHLDLSTTTQHVLAQKLKNKIAVGRLATWCGSSYQELLYICTWTNTHTHVFLIPLPPLRERKKKQSPYVNVISAAHILNRIRDYL